MRTSMDTGRQTISLFLRGFAVVFFVAMNTVFISQGRFGWSFIAGVGVSTVWLANVRVTVKRVGWHGDLAYVLGAGCGTVAGMWMGQQ